MREEVAQELTCVERQYGGLEVDAQSAWMIVVHYPLPLGWNKPETKILVLIPPGYPTTPPDNFYTDDDLRLADGSQAANASPGQSAAGGTWQQFSYHVQAGEWQPHAEPLRGDNLLTFMAAVGRRLSEVE